MYLLLHFSSCSERDAIPPISGHFLNHSPPTFSVWAHNVMGKPPINRGKFISKISMDTPSLKVMDFFTLMPLTLSATLESVYLKISHEFPPPTLTSQTFIHSATSTHSSSPVSTQCLLYTPSGLQLPTICLHLLKPHLQSSPQFKTPEIYNQLSTEYIHSYFS